MNNNNITAVTCSLTSSFSLVPPEAIPAIVDCILTSSKTSSISTLSLFNSLLNSFSLFTKGIAEKDEGVDSSQYSYIRSFVAALCHLVKKSGNANVLQTFIWRSFLPVLRILNENDHELLNSVKLIYIYFFNLPYFLITGFCVFFGIYMFLVTHMLFILDYRTTMWRCDRE
ncbi:hypothetical protein MKW94_000345 [Papaver nudicaule]|uniref:Uncharacterized protein n=1 Tax=Papaver nudicaule TaxID=74823 RepID=A0AA41RX80_PAPNU|nr:hypothetical protein [Papaver nudicaule]